MKFWSIELPRDNQDETRLIQIDALRFGPDPWHWLPHQPGRPEPSPRPEPLLSSYHGQRRLGRRVCGSAGSSRTGALRPTDVRIAIGSQSDGGSFVEYLCARVLWKSPPDALDAVLIELDRFAQGIALLAIAPRDRLLAADNPVLALIGHPEGGLLKRKNALLVDKGPRGTTPGPEYLHYQMPRDAAQQGGTVLETKTLTVVGMHRDNAFVGRPNLNGKPGTNNASEGIWIHSILDAIRRQLDFIMAARAWVANGKPTSALLSARKLTAIDAQLVTDPLAPSIADEAVPFLAGSRRVVAGRHSSRLRALAAALALLPIVIAAIAQLWISGTSFALTQLLPAGPTRIGGFLDPGAKANGPLD